jgi:glycosyltransferase involved in cell wall biosynthesis
LARQGHEVGVIFFDRLIPSVLYPGRKRLNNNPDLEFEFENISTLHVMNYYNLGISKKSKKRIVDFKADFSIIHWWTFAIFPMTSMVSRFLNSIRCPVIFEMHEVIDQNDARIPLVSGASRLMGGRILRRSAKIIAHSESDLDLIGSHYNIPRESLEKIPLANYSKFGSRISKELAREKLAINQESVILFFGLIREYKGVLTLIDAFERMEVDSTLLLIVGEIWDQKREILQAIEKSPKKENIRLIGRFVDDSEISTIYSAADVLAMPYTRASQSAVGSVAMDFGVPITAFAVGGLTDSLADYTNGFLVEPGNVDQFASTLESAKNMEIQGPGGFEVDNVMREWCRVGNDLLEG